MTVLEKAGSGSVEPEDFNAVIDELNSGVPAGAVTAGDVDSQAAQDGDVLTADGAGGAAWEAGGGSQPWVGPFPVGWADFQPSYQTILADAAPYAGKILVAALVIPTEDWNDTGDTVGLSVYVGDPNDASFVIDDLSNIDIKNLTVSDATDGQGNVSGRGSIVLSSAIIPSAMQTPIRVGDGPLNKVFAYFAAGNNDGTTGAADLYLCFITPTAPAP